MASVSIADSGGLRTQGDHNHKAQLFLLPFSGQGHLFPFIELTKHLSITFTTTLLLPSSISSSIPSSFGHVQILDIPFPPPGPGPLGPKNDQLSRGIEVYLRSSTAKPVCVVIDVMMGWVGPVFRRYNVPVVSVFTSGACSMCVEYGLWKADRNLEPEGEDTSVLIPGLPEEMAVSCSDLNMWANHHPPPGPTFDGPGLMGPLFGPVPDSPHEPGLMVPPPSPRPDGPYDMALMGTPLGPRPDKPDDPGLMGEPPGPRPDGPHGSGLMGPPVLGQKPPWVDEVAYTMAVMINTCQELEGPFLDYLANQLGKPVWGVGPLLPEQYWRLSGSPVHDHEIRANKESNYTEEEVIQWLDSKPRGSVLYISFGSEVGPTVDEYAELARALEELGRPFIWVIRSSLLRPGAPPPRAGALSALPPRVEDEYYPYDLDHEVGKMGLIIRGWAPQLLILTHSSTGGFLSHCGWNSTVEAIVRAVPILAWPIRGDQHYNAKLIASHLKVGYTVKKQFSDMTSRLPEMVKKDDIIRGIEKLMSDEAIKQRANEVRAKFEGGFPLSSKVALEAFRAFIQ